MVEAMKPTFGSLFAGIGGIDIGLETAGWECRWQVESDPFCTKVLEEHWADVKRYGDCRSIKPGELEPVDLICGGFPCQSVSMAGKRKGVHDPRWLWPEFRRFIRGLEPRWVLAENVPGLLSIDSGRLFGGILRDLALLGYDAEWDCIPAAAFGAPHLRYRVFIVAHTNHPRQLQSEGSFCQEREWLSNGSPYVSDPSSQRCRANEQNVSARQPDSLGSRKALSDTLRQRCNGRPRIFQATGQTRQFLIEGDHPWQIEPDVGRVAYGVPHRVDRLKSLGNAVVPQVAEWIGRRILEYGQ